MDWFGAIGGLLGGLGGKGGSGGGSGGGVNVNVSQKQRTQVNVGQPTGGAADTWTSLLPVLVIGGAAVAVALIVSRRS